MKRVVTAVLSLVAAGCLNTVEDHWCDSQTPCTQGFVCTSTFHCIAAPRADGGTGGGHDGGFDGHQADDEAADLGPLARQQL